MANLLNRLPARQTALTVAPASKPPPLPTADNPMALRGMADKLGGDPYVIVEEGKNIIGWEPEEKKEKRFRVLASQNDAGEADVDEAADLLRENNWLENSFEKFHQNLQGTSGRGAVYGREAEEGPGDGGRSVPSKGGGVSPKQMKGGASPYASPGADFKMTVDNLFDKYGESFRRGSTAMRANDRVYVIPDKSLKEMSKTKKEIVKTIISDIAKKAR